MILLMDANELTDHDQYVCHEFRDPFQYRVPGYAMPGWFHAEGSRDALRAARRSSTATAFGGGAGKK